MERTDDIAQEILRNREKGTGRLVTEYKDRLYAVALALCRNPTEAEDLALQTIERAVDKIELYEDRDSFYEWMQVILLNIYRNSIRGKTLRNTVLLDDVGDADKVSAAADADGVDGAQRIYAAVDSAILRDAICRLPPEMKETVVLHYFMDLPLKRIAQMLTVPVGTVMSRLYYARVVLGRRLGVRLKKSAVALIAAGLFLLAGAATIVGVAMVSSPSPQPAATGADLSDPSAVRPFSLSTPQEDSAMKKKSSIVGSFRKLMNGMTAVALMSLAANGADNDPYIESAGTTGIDTGCRLTPNSRLEIDFALTSTDDAAQWRVFGSDSVNAGLKAEFYVTGSATWGAIVGNGVDAQQTLWLSDGTDFIPADTVRHQAVFDIVGDRLSFLTAGETVWTRATGLASFTKDATIPVTLFARYSSAAMTAYSQPSKARIYGLRIYEGGDLAHDFEPCVKDGLAGFRDRVTGDFVTNGGAFTTFTAGGDHETYESPYVATPSGNSAVYIQTGYVATSNTCVELDCSFVDNPSAAGEEWYLFAGAGGNNHFRSLISSGYGYYATVNGSNQRIADTFIVNNWASMAGVRRTFVTDEYSRRTCVITAGVTNGVNTSLPISTQNGAKSGLHLASNWNHTGNFSPLKIYGCRIYESGVLVRDYVPCMIGPRQDGPAAVGLRDTLTGAFATYPNPTGSSRLACGGDLFPAEPPSVETLRADRRYIDTGYTVTANTKVEIDYAQTEERAAGDTWYLFHARQPSPVNHFAAYINDNAFGFINSGQSWVQRVGASLTNNAVNVRRTVVLDNPAGLGVIITAGATNATCATVASGTYSGSTLKIASDYTGGNHYASIRIYGCRIWEKEDGEYALKRDYVPAVENGVAGLRDVLPGGEFKPCGSGAVSQLTHCGLFPVKAEQSATRISHSQSVTLTASAPGATSYRWLKNGEPVSGGTDGTLTVPWQKGHSADAYQAVAQFTADGLTVEGEPSATLTVLSLPMGTVFVFR